MRETPIPAFLINFKRFLQKPESRSTERAREREREKKRAERERAERTERERERDNSEIRCCSSKN